MAREVVVIGAGIVGLSTASELQRRIPDARVTVLEKEADICLHQTGRNSGVTHSGIYYKPGSFKAQFCSEGRRAIETYAAEHGISYKRTGKLIVATERDELPRLAALEERGRQHGLTITRLDQADALQFEPHVNCIGAIHVAETGIIDYKGVARQMLADLEASGGQLVLGQHVDSVRRGSGRWTIASSGASHTADYVVNCAGLHSDVIANGFGLEKFRTRIIPFRGEYFDLAESAARLVNGLIYPVPNPELPFLGVHLTRMINGAVHAGPNAVLALAREGYKWTHVNGKDLARTLAYPGFLRLASRNLAIGAYEVRRSLSRRLFVRDLQRLVPEIRREHLVKSAAGVRAQAVDPDGSLVDDFRIINGWKSLHVVNAPSPAATSALAIGRHVANQVVRELSD